MWFLSKLRPFVFGATMALAMTCPVIAADQPTIGVVVPTLDAQFWNNYIAFMKKGASELGENLVVMNADNKPDQMIKSLEDLVALHVKGNIFTHYSAPGTKKFTLDKEANIAVIITDGYPDFPPQGKRFP